MRTFTSETALAAVELEQLVADWCRDLDANGGLGAFRFFTEDCVVDCGAIAYNGHAGMKKFYLDRAERVRTTEKDGARSARHSYASLRVMIAGVDRATVTFAIINFSGSGHAPLFNATTPAIVSDVRLECRRAKDGAWLIAGFYGWPIFVGADPFVNRMVVGIEER
jgi:hypothetical protein